jgi:hypothetical protein
MIEPAGRHCEGAKRRSNPDLAHTALVWIASLPLAMTAAISSEIISL